MDEKDLNLNLRELRPSENGTGIDVKTDIAPSSERGKEVIRMMAEHLMAVFEESGARNYLEMQLHDKSGEVIIVTLCLRSGKTPAQILKETKDELDLLAWKTAETQIPQ